jgi:hypothetical protein
MICKYCGESVVGPCNERMYQQCFFYLPAQTNPPAQSSSSTETQLSNRHDIIDLWGLTLQSFVDIVNTSEILQDEQKIVLKAWLKTQPSVAFRAIALGFRRVILDAIMAAYARDSLSTASIGPKLPFERASPSLTTAKAEDAQGEKTGVREPLHQCPHCLDYPARLTIKQPDNLFGP